MFQEEYRIQVLSIRGEVYGTHWKQDDGESEDWVRRAKSLSETHKVWVEWRFLEIESNQGGKNAQ